MKDEQSASAYLHVHRARGQPVLVHHAFGVEVGEGRPFLYVRQHARVTHSEPAVLSLPLQRLASTFRNAPLSMAL